MRMSACRSVAFVVVMTAMLLRAALPSGWMPDFVQGHGSLLVMCSLSGPAHFISGAGGERLKHKPAHGDTHSDICPFAAAAQLASFNGQIPLPDPGLSIAPPRLHLPRVQAIAASRYLPHSPRAPPVLA